MNEDNLMPTGLFQIWHPSREFVDEVTQQPKLKIMSDIFSSIVEAIKGSVPIQTIVPKYGEYFSETLHRVDDAPTVEPMVGYTLTGLLDFIENLESNSSDSLIDLIQVVSPTEVKVYGPYYGFKNRRHLYYRSVFPMPGLQLFKEEEEYEIATLIQKLQINFAETKVQQDLIEFLSHVSLDDTKEITNTGICENVVVKSGVQLGQKPLPKVLKLSPYRTFPEVERLESTFSLSARRYSGSFELKLRSNDGGQWQVEAMQAIKNYLVNKLTEAQLDISVIC